MPAPILTPTQARYLERCKAGDIDWRDVPFRTRLSMPTEVLTWDKALGRSRPKKRAAYRQLTYGKVDVHETLGWRTYPVLLDDAVVGHVESHEEQTITPIAGTRLVRRGADATHWVASATENCDRPGRIGYQYDTRDAAALAIVEGVTR